MSKQIEMDVAVGNERFRVRVCVCHFAQCIFCVFLNLSLSLSVSLSLSLCTIIVFAVVVCVCVVTQGDMRQFAGVLFGLSICATFFPLANVSKLIGPDDTTADRGIEFASLFGGLCVIVTGLTGMLVGYACLVHDYGNLQLTKFLLVIVQTAYIPYITDIWSVGRTADSGVGFIDEIYNPTVPQVRFVGALGIFGILSYGACFLGSLAFTAFAMYAFQTGHVAHRPSSYYRGRLGFYCGLVMTAGFAQLLLGAFCLQ